jgi:hypothetical protein
MTRRLPWRANAGMRAPLVTLGEAQHNRVEAAEPDVCFELCRILGTRAVQTPAHVGLSLGAIPRGPYPDLTS